MSQDSLISNRVCVVQALKNQKIKISKLGLMVARTCHDSVYDALFLALTSTQAIAGLTLTFTPHNSQPLVTHHLTYAYRLTHPYLPSHMTPSQ